MRSAIGQKTNWFAAFPDPDWVYTDASRRFATYTLLDPGEYIFRVKGSNNDGIWNEEGTSIKISISPPWWQTTWAYAFYALFILSTVYGTWRFQINRFKMKHQLELEHQQALAEIFLRYLVQLPPDQ